MAEMSGRRASAASQKQERLTLNQRVQGSSPCAPTNHFKYLADRKAIGRILVSALCPKAHGRLTISEGWPRASSCRAERSPDPASLHDRRTDRRLRRAAFVVKCGLSRLQQLTKVSSRQCNLEDCSLIFARARGELPIVSLDERAANR